MRIAVLVSGSGTNLQALIDAVRRGELDADIRVVVSNRADAGGLARARDAGLATELVSHKDYPSREAFDAAVVDVLRSHDVEWVVLAGFLRVVTHVLLDAYPGRVLNIHPALLPAFPGLHAQAQALAFGVRFSGCTVHFVDEGTDTGPIIDQAAVPVTAEDTVDSLTARILAAEHALLPSVLQSIAEGRVILEAPAAPGARPRVRVRPREAPK